jgi:peptidyl-prolyl cis-trans isomerase D
MMTFLRSQSQAVLAVLLGVIALGFVFYGSAGTLLTNSVGHTTSDFGRIDGQDVSSAEMISALTNTRSSYQLQGHGDDLDQPGARAHVNEEAWQQLLLLHEADRLHITVTNKQLIDAIRAIPMFQKDGAFSPDTYQAAMVSMENSRYHITAQKFEQIMRNDLLLEAVRNALVSSVRSAPQGVSEQFEKYYGPVTVSVVTFDPKTFVDPAQVKPEEIEAEYKAHPDNPAYRTPEKRKVDYVLLTLTPDQAKLPDKEKAAAKDALGQKALDFALAFQPDPSANGGAAPTPPDFLAEAKKRGLTPATTDFFTADTPPANLPPSPAFNSAAFAPSLTKEDPVSKVVELDNGVAVLHLVDDQPSQLRPLDDVKVGIATELQEQKASQAAATAAQSASMALQTAVAKGTDFKAAAADLKLNVSTLPAFVPLKAAQTDPKLQAIAYSVLPLALNQVSGPIPMQDDNTTIILHVDSRAKADPAGLAEFEKRYLPSADQQLRGAVLSDWADWAGKQPGTHKPADLDSFGGSSD